MLVRSREFTLTGRSLLLIGTAALPAIVWATAFGRPRHQSLILVLMAMGFTAEYERWQIELTPKRAWNIFAGVVWGLACWTSLFEPSVVVAVLILFNLAVRRRESFIFLVSFGVVVFLMILLEGGHIFSNIFNIYHLTPEYREYAFNWLKTIAEVQPVSIAGMVTQMTLILLILPLVAWRLWPRASGNKTDALLIILTLILIILMALQSRWIYYAALGEIFLVARYCQTTPLRWTKVFVLVFFLIGLADADYEQIIAHPGAAQNQPSLEMAQISRGIDHPGGIMAPWWISPGLLYFSGQPIVSGSSHCGMTGIVDSAQFFAATSWEDAERILKQRQVRWIVVWDDERFELPVLNTSLEILGQPQVTYENPGNAGNTVVQMLIADRFLPTSIKLRSVSQHMKLYEYTPDGA
jgi:hypothetical protein